MIKIKDVEVRPEGCMGHVLIYRQIEMICELSSDILRYMKFGSSIDLKGWNQLWYYGESNYEPSK